MSARTQHAKQSHHWIYPAMLTSQRRSRNCVFTAVELCWPIRQPLTNGGRARNLPERAPVRVWCWADLRLQAADE
jgi:hypothetical protein